MDQTIYFTWKSKHRVLLTFSETWSVQAFAEQVAACYADIQANRRDVDLILDLRCTRTNAPRSFLRVARKMIQRLPGNVCHVVVVSPYTMWRAMYDTLLDARMIQPHCPFTFTATPEQALRSLRHVRDTRSAP
jgi:hypothetical protein